MAVLERENGMIQRIAIATALVAAAGCSTLLMDPLEQFRVDNKKNLDRVAVGMTRMEVESVMGNGRAGGGLPEVAFGRVQYLAVRNPMRVENVMANDGSAYHVLFYYTDVRTLDDKVTDDELTPVVLRDDKVAGIGYGFLGTRAPKYAQFTTVK
jgi:hypothetical protein